MFFLYLIAGIAIGFLMATPIGAVGILCVHRTLDQGRRQGYITGVAGASADLVFCLISASGIKFISDFITEHRHEIRIIGGIILVLMGALLVSSPRRSRLVGKNTLEQTGVFLSTFFVAMTNPLVLFSYAAVLALIGVERLTIGLLSVLFAGIFLGSFLWFVFIANLAYRFQLTLTDEKLAVVNRIAGLLLILLGLSAVGGGITGMA